MKKINMKNKCLVSGFMIGLFLIGCLSISNAQTVFTVTNTSDATTSTPGQLRYAIERANENAGTCIINFNIPNPNNLTEMVISLVSALPAITHQTWIDGTTQPGAAIVIEGSKGTPNMNNWISLGLAITSAPGSKLLGLRIQSFTEGVNINYSDNTEIRNCYIFLCPSRNVVIKSSSNCILKGNTINANDAGSVLFTPTSSHIGLLFTNDGTVGTTNNLIGSTEGCDRNTFVQCGGSAIDHLGTNLALNNNNKFTGNRYISAGVKAINLNSGNGNLSPPTISNVSGCTVSGTTIANGTIELYGATSSDKKNGNYYLLTVKANSGGAWTANLGFIPHSYVCATVTNASGSTSGLCTGASVTPSTLSWNIAYESPCDYPVVGTPITLINNSNACAGTSFLWSFNDGSQPSADLVHYFSTPEQNQLNLSAILNSCDKITANGTVNLVRCLPTKCTNCIGSFAPEAGDYIISGWVKKETAVPTDLTYVEPQLLIEFSPGSIQTAGPFTASGQIIDGWQRIESKFTIPTNATDITVKLNCTAGNCLFDDIRISPVKSSMKSFVFDGTSLLLIAEHDERNYTTFYEYNEEGKLVRIKKETERGIATLKENRSNSPKR
jgi:hypothetical protein